MKTHVKAYLRVRSRLALIMSCLLIFTSIAGTVVNTVAPLPAGAAVPAMQRRFHTDDGHVGPVIHRSNNLPAYCINFRVAGPNNHLYSRGTKLSTTAGSLGRALSIAVELGPRSLSGGTTINGVALTNLEWRMATQLAVFRLQGESLPYSTTTRHWQASTWIVNRARNASTVQLNRYWQYNPPAGVTLQNMVLSQGDPLTARVRVQKRDAGTNAILAGAVFGLWTNEVAARAGNTNAASFRGRATTGTDGFAQWFRLPVNQTYFVRELVPPQGYTLNTTVLSVRPLRGNDSETAQGSLPLYDAGTIHNNRISIRGDISIEKYSSKLGGITNPLEGVQFTITDLTPRDLTGSPNPRYRQIIGTLTTDVDGRASSRDLIPPQNQWAGTDFTSGFLTHGDYLLSEIASTTPQGLQVIEDMPFSIRDNGVTLHYRLYNHQIVASLSIAKRDAETQRIIPLADTQVQLFDADMNLLSFEVSSSESGEESSTVSTFTTDDSGQINIPHPLVYGNYFLKELQAPYGYTLLKEPLPFTVSRMHDQSDPLVVVVDNYPAKGRVRVIKTDSVTATAVPGTTFELHAKNDIITGDDTVRLQAGELADTLVSDEQGLAESIPLYLGNYVLTEVATHPNYFLNLNSFDVDLRYQDQDTAIVWAEVAVENDPVLVSCEVEKRTIDVTSAAFRSVPRGGNVDNSAQGAQEQYRYDVDFRSTSNDWADEFVVIDTLDGVRAGQIRLSEIWTPVVWGDSNGLYNIWYQTNLSDETTRYSDSFAASKDEPNPANPDRFMRFNNLGWRLWAEDVSSTQRRNLQVADLGLKAGEYVTSLKLEFGRVEKGFTSRNSGVWAADNSERFYTAAMAAATGLAPLSYLVYFPEPLAKYDENTGTETVIVNSVTSHITRNIVLQDDCADTVETRLVDSFTVEDRNDLRESEREHIAEDPQTAALREEGQSAGLPAAGDSGALLIWLFVLLASMTACITAVMKLNRKKKGLPHD